MATASIAPSLTSASPSRRCVSSHWGDWRTARSVSRSRSRLPSLSLVAVAPRLRAAAIEPPSLGPRGRVLGTRALHALTPVLLNSAVSVGVAWLTALCYSLGNVFSGLGPQQQTRRAFLIATLLWVHVFFCAAVCVARSIALVRLHLLAVPHRRAGAPRMLVKMLRRTALWFVFSGAMIAAVGYACAGLSDHWRQYRIELYACSLWYYSFLPAADRAARHIFRDETVEGQQRREQQRQLKQQQQEMAAAAVPAATPRRHRQRPRPHHWLSAVCHGSTGLVALIVPVVYVHAISLLGVAAASHYVAALTVGSVALKLALQEVAKLYIVRRGIQNKRAMALLVAVPTVLIDTQVRIVLLRFQSVQLALSTTLALAVGEIVARVAKAAWLQRQIRRRVAVVTAATERSRRLSVTATASARAIGAVARPPAAVEPVGDASWRAQLLKYHATELCADMYAEYLAIGCSSAITVIFGNHPHFLFRATSDASSSSSSSSFHVVAPLLTQVAVEVVVDAASCVAELANGLDLVGDDARERVYFLVFFVALGIVNVNTSAILYLAY